MSVDYKYKPDKHKYRVGIRTIDEIHKEHLEKFRKNRESLPEKKKQLEELEDKLRNLKSPIIVDLDTDTMMTETDTEEMDIQNLNYSKTKSTIKSKISKLKKEIYNIENFVEEMEYFSKTGDVIYDYYDLTNGLLYNNTFDKNEKEIEENINSSGKRVTVSDELLAITNSNKKKKMKKPVKKRTRENEKPEKTIMSLLLGSDDEKDDPDNPDEKSNDCRATLQNEYLIMVDKEYACSKTKVNPIKRCKECGIDKVLVYAESIMTCPKCGESEDIFIESDVPLHKEAFTEKPKYPYKKINHLIEKLNQFQSKETANIPDFVFTVLDEEIKKHGFNDDDISMEFLEKMLKKHRLSSYYEHNMYIYSKITKTSPPAVTREETDIILKMFNQAEDTYEKKYKPKGRNNFLKYSFVLHKIFLTLEKPTHANYFKLLKSGSKLKQQEKVWKNICFDHGWKYYSS
jgi:hypothetical protein